MSVNGDVAEQVVRLSLEGLEIAVKLTGSGVKNIAVMLYAILNEQKRTKGKARLTTMLKTGKPLKIFTLKQEDLKAFSEKAKKYGILYCALVDKNSDGIVDILVKEEDAPRINRIIERFKITTVDTVKITTEGTKTNEKQEEKSQAATNKDFITKDTTKENFKSAKTEKIPLSEHSSRTLEMQDGVAKRENKPSISKELAKLKVEAMEKYKQKSKTKDNSRISNIDEILKKFVDAPLKKNNRKGKNLLE